ncbi:MAG: hypothetical protein HC902_08950, partial [Calothrix sp. SM1_5_4]|nr:hypothetical protein [Calothrix sp. SM1_5_4]
SAAGGFGILVSGLEGMARQTGTTLFTLLLASFGALLSRHGAGAEVAVGSPVANRRRPELEGLVGCLINTLVLRLRLAGDPSWLETTRRAREVLLAALAHQDFHSRSWSSACSRSAI